MFYKIEGMFFLTCHPKAALPATAQQLMFKL